MKPQTELSDALRRDHGIRDGALAYDLGALLERHTHVRSPREIVKLEGEKASVVYFVISGWLAVSKSMEDGHRQIIDIVMPGDFLSPGSADQSISSVEIEPLTEVSLAMIPQQIWVRYIREHPTVGRAFDRGNAATICRMSERMLRLGKGSAESRISYAICELCLRSCGGGLEENKEFHIPLTQLQLGDFTGLSAVHVCRTLRRFTRKRIVKVADQMRIVICDLEALADVAEIDPQTLSQKICTQNALLHP